MQGPQSTRRKPTSMNVRSLGRALLLAIGVAAVTVNLGGCASTMGQDSIRDESKVSQIVVGKSTTKDVQALLGEPNSTMRDGNKLAWVYVSTKTNAAAYIPFVNMVGGGNRGDSENMTITFDSKGVVRAIDHGQMKF